MSPDLIHHLVTRSRLNLQQARELEKLEGKQPAITNCSLYLILGAGQVTCDWNIKYEMQDYSYNFIVEFLRLPIIILMNNISIYQLLSPTIIYQKIKYY